MFWPIGLLQASVCKYNYREYSYIYIMSIKLRFKLINFWTSLRDYVTSLLRCHSGPENPLRSCKEAGFTGYPPRGSFMTETRSPGSWSICSPVFYVDMDLGFALRQWPRLSCPAACVHRCWSGPPWESLQSSHAQCHSDNRLSCSVAVVWSRPRTAGLTPCM